MDPELARHLNALDSRTLGSRIKAARVAAGLTQPALGDNDASVAYVSRIERGERRPGPGLLKVFADRLGVTLDQLVLGYAAKDASEAELELDYGELALTAGEVPWRNVAVLGLVGLIGVIGGLVIFERRDLPS